VRPGAAAEQWAGSAVGFVRFRMEDVEQSIPARFERQAERYPDRLAVDDGVRAGSYTELNGRANRVAHAILARRGDGPEPVAVLLDHDASLAAAILGVLKAGKFYVPLDPAAPRARTAAVLDDCGARLIVTRGQLRSPAAALAGPERVLLDLDELEAVMPAENPGLLIQPDAFAYVIYTSGTTGRPKGVVDRHRNVLHNVMRYTNGYRIGPHDRLTLLQTAANSGSVSSLFGALLNGATVLPFDLRARGLGALADWLAGEGITIYHSVPTIFRHMLRPESRFPAVRLVRLEGDRASRSDVELFRRHFGPSCSLAVGLGITETGLIRRYVIGHDAPPDEGPVPVGYPVEDMEVRLLGEDGEPAGPGHVGEIAVRSRYLAAGYWRRPDLTAAAFRPDPDGGDARIYKTGDLGRMRADGCLEYLGRKDAQVKIRGHRVELIEVENALLETGRIREAAVAAREDRFGDARLVAYIVPERRPAPSGVELRGILGRALPDYMLPAAFVELEALPLNPNGKVDRRTLPDPPSVRPELATPYVAPRTPLEALLAGIWAEVLGLDRVGVDDRFLDLGGDSLLAARVAARVRDALGIGLPPAALLATPTVAGQALAALREGLGQCDGGDPDFAPEEGEALVPDVPGRARAAEEQGR
jgi:amino acid adenylation domain-containing protein